MTKATYRRKGLLKAYSARGLGLHHHHSGERGSRQANMVLEQQLSVHILIHKAESTLGWEWKPQIPSSETHFLQQGPIASPPKRINQAVFERQVFKHLGANVTQIQKPMGTIMRLQGCPDCSMWMTIVLLTMVMSQ